MSQRIVHEREVAAEALEARREETDDLVDRQPADPRLDAEPAAGHQRTQQRRNVRARDAERRPRVDRKRDAVPGAGVPVEDQRDQHDGVAQQDHQQALPPVHPRLDQARRQHVRRDANAHPHPQRRNVPAVPRTLGEGRRRQVFVRQAVVWKRLGEFDHGG